MNIDQMAHEYAKIILEAGLRNDWDMTDIDDCAKDAYWMAEAMLKESEKHKKVERPSVLFEPVK
jgi:hypothetical protein